MNRHDNASGGQTNVCAIQMVNLEKPPMRILAILLAAVFAAAVPARAEDAMILKAGEWSVMVDNQPGEPHLICYGEDHPLGQIAGGQMDGCVQHSTVSGGKVMTIDAICRTPGSRVLVHGTITALGHDTYRTDSDLLFDRAGFGGRRGVSLKILARRVGPCRPGDETE